MQLPSTHPYWHVASVIHNEPKVSKVYLSFYRYRPQSLIDERSSFIFDRETFLSAANFAAFLNRCPPGFEAAFHSLVACLDGQPRHLPLVDMSTESASDLVAVNSFLHDENFYGFSWFESGRSFHGYGGRLITHNEWIQFMGKLLLCNPKDRDPLVDPRWIGHRLIGGYAALRWTHNTDQYLSLPKLFGSNISSDSRESR